MNAAVTRIKPPAPPEADLPKEPVTETIAVHLAADVHSNVLIGIRELAVSELEAKRAEEADARERSIDARLSVLEAREQRNVADDIAHEARRIEAAIAKLDERLPVKKQAEHHETIMPAYIAYRDGRAAFIERLRDRWPKLAAEIVEILAEIERYRAGPGIEIPEGEDPLREDVEAVARNCPGNFYLPNGGPIMKLAYARIPDLNPNANPQYQWPPADYRRW